MAKRIRMQPGPNGGRKHDDPPPERKPHRRGGVALLAVLGAAVASLLFCSGARGSGPGPGGALSIGLRIERKVIVIPSPMGGGEFHWAPPDTAGGTPTIELDLTVSTNAPDWAVFARADSTHAPSRAVAPLVRWETLDPLGRVLRSGPLVGGGSLLQGAGRTGTFSAHVCFRLGNSGLGGLRAAEPFRVRFVGTPLDGAPNSPEGTR